MLKDKYSDHGDNYCQNELDLNDAKITELNLEIKMCHAEETGLNLDKLSDMFDKERKKFDDIMSQN